MSIKEGEFIKKKRKQNYTPNNLQRQFFQIADNCHCEECNDKAISLLI